MPAMLGLAFHRRMMLLALVATVLLLVAPVTSRLLSSQSANEGDWTQMCTAAGLKLVKLSPADSLLWQAAPDQKAPPAGMLDEHCAYCPLLAGLALLLVWMLVTAPASTMTSGLRWRLRALPPLRHPSGLGSRGPPLAV